MSHTERHTTLAWADQLDTQRRATTRGTTWSELDAAIHAHLTHAPGSLADCGTESLYDQALLPTQPMPLDAPVQTPAPAAQAADDGMPCTATLLLLAVAGVAIGIALSWFWPMGFAG
jgi:hypothetical protein